MKLLVEGSNLQGNVQIPGSKSHTIRAVTIAALAEGDSVIAYPLDSADTRAAFNAYNALGAEVSVHGTEWRVKGVGGKFTTPDSIVDVGNSGTTMRMVLGSAAMLSEGIAVLTGDAQIRRRPNGPLAQSLNDLGAQVESTRNNGCPPFVVKGKLQGGETTIEAVTSQYVSSLLINTPLAEKDTTIHVPLLHEKPYVHITLDWLKRQGIALDYAEDLSEFRVPGGQAYQPVNGRIPADFSSATFFLAAGALQDNEILCQGLDLSDTQGDKAVVEYLKQMGAKVTEEAEGIRVAAHELKGCEIDMNATPDALPMMAVLACFAQGTTRLVNVPQARLKETDRIAVMAQELSKLGAKIEELEDGLVIAHSPLQAGEVEGHDDHRVVMSLAIAGTMLPGTTTINGYEAVEITYPTFFDALTSLGGKAQLV